MNQHRKKKYLFLKKNLKQKQRKNKCLRFKGGLMTQYVKRISSPRNQPSLECMKKKYLI
jgi:hypothetical protein